jgi:adenosylhomocysteine nucleosidase
MPEEIATLLPLLADRRSEHRGPFEVHAGVLDGHPVRLAVCGIGKVNAAALAQQLLGDGAARLLFTGVAGALDPELRVGDVVVADDAVQHDVDVTPLGYEPGRVPGEPLAWTADPALRDAALAAARATVQEGRVVRGRIASGDAFVAEPARAAELRARFGAVCAEMEGAAAAQVCARWGVPWAVVRSISDTADAGASVDFRAFTRRAAARAEGVVRGVLARLADADAARR